MISLIFILAFAASPALTADGNRVEEAMQLLAQAEGEIAKGDYASAMRHAADAAEFFGAVGDRSRQGRALNRVGQAALYAGQYGKAADSFQTAMTLSAAAGDSEGEAEQRGNLGNVHFFAGRYSDAERAYDAALGLVEQAQAAEWTLRRRRILLANKAALFQRLGRDADALDIYQALGGPSELPPAEYAQLLVNRGALYRRLGDPIKALAVYEDARRLFERDRHIDGELAAIRNRGIVLALDLDQLDGADRAFSALLTLAASAGNRRELLLARLYRGETRLRSGTRDAALVDFSTAVNLAGELKTPEEEWKALYGLGRSVTDGAEARRYLTRSIEVIERIREQIRVPSLRVDFFNDKADVYDALIAARLAEASPDEMFMLIERSHSRVWREQLGLSGAVDLASVRRALPERTLLLDYWNSPRGSVLVAATRDRAAVLPLAVRDGEIKGLVDAVASSDLREWRAPAQVVSSRVMPPADWFDNVAHVVIVPAGSLAVVPFELLTAGGSLLIERAAISYTPTAATVLRPRRTPARWSPPWHVQLRAFADPISEGSSGEEGLAPTTSLTSSAGEIRAVASELAGGSLLHLAGDNLKAHLWEPNQPPILHIASHAVASTTTLEQSRILFSSAGGRDTPADYLFLKEAYELPLGGVELAVLSACDTERGPLVRGEGVQSFSRAFLAAGARSTVTTLWRVADAPTARFMEVFYHHLQRGEPRDEALRRAKLALFHSGHSLAHPHFWAAFVLAGDGERPVPRATSWSMVIVAACLLGLGVGGVVGGTKKLWRARRGSV